MNMEKYKYLSEEEINAIKYNDELQTLTEFDNLIVSKVNYQKVVKILNDIITDENKSSFIANFIEHTKLGEIINDFSINNEEIDFIRDSLGNLAWADIGELDKVLQANYETDNAEISLTQIKEIKEKELIDSSNVIKKDYEYLPPFTKGLRERFNKIKSTKTILSGLKTLDENKNTEHGFYSGSVVYLGGAPSMCKTMLSINMAISFLKQGYDVIYLSLETSITAIAKRFMTTYTSSSENYKSDPNAFSWKKVEEMSEENQDKFISSFEENPLFKNLCIIDDIRTSEDINSFLLGTEEFHIGDKKYAPIPLLYSGVRKPMVILDYLHYVTSADSKLDASKIIKNVGQSFKSYVNQNDALALVLYANNRSDNKEPSESSMYSGRDTSDIEYSASYNLQLNYADWESRDFTSNEQQIQWRERKDNIRNLALTFHKDKEGKAKGLSIKLKVYLNGQYVEDVGELIKLPIPKYPLKPSTSKAKKK